jgi:ligand-binding sensor domain-containing protein
LGLTEDSLHNIWIGTPAGLSRYDIKADTFTNFLDNPGIIMVLFGQQRMKYFL